MSTLEKCYAANLLVRIKGNLRAHQQPQRLLVGGYDVIEDIKARLPAMVTDNFYPGSNRPMQQAAVLFNLFVSGEDLDEPLPHEMRPLGQGVWRLRTFDLRFDGWFPEPNFFVIGAFDHKQETEKPGRSDEMYDQVLALRASTNLNGGVFSVLKDYHDLVRL